MSKVAEISKVSDKTSKTNKINPSLNGNFSSADKTYIQELSKTLSKQVTHDLLKEKYAGKADVLKLVGMGAFAVATLAMPGLPKALKPFVNIPYLKRTLKRLEKQKLVKFSKENGATIVDVTDNGRRQILKYSLDTIEIKKPRYWDGTWRLVAYDIPNTERHLRDVVQEYLAAWGFYLFQESVYLHAYPCEKEITYLREYLGVGKYLRVLTVSKIENDQAFRKFFDVS